MSIFDIKSLIAEDISKAVTAAFPAAELGVDEIK